ncbi:MAG: hypothetical protein IJS61_00640 [Firmicutes bacterium]|nr:hypothetical protein [Bacillota bacterium]
MKIDKITNPIQKKFVEIDATANINADIETRLTYVVETNNIYPTKKEEFDKLVENVKEDIQKNGNDISDRDAHRAAAFTSGIAVICTEIFNDDADAQKCIDALNREFEIFSGEEFTQDPFLKKSFSEYKKGKYTITTDKIHPYQICVYSEPKRDGKTGIIIPRLCTVEDEFSYPVLLRDDNVISTVNPSVHFTVKRHVEAAKGRVLVLGCKLGYYPYLASLKDEVESITIVEENKDLAELFKEAILPTFEQKEKINVETAEPTLYLKGVKDGEYDVCYVNNWINLSETGNYLKMKHAAKAFDKTVFTYQDEEAFLLHLSSFVCRKMEETYYLALGYDPSQIPLLPPSEEKKAKYVEKLTKSVVIDSPEAIDKYLDPLTIKEMIETLPCKY